MLSAFASVGARSFDLSLTDLNGAPLKGLQRPGRSLEEMRRTIGRVLYDAARNQHNIIIRPRSATALLIQLDDFTAEKAAQVELGFLTVCTSQNSYQVWLAISDAPSENQKEAAKQFRTRVRRGAGADQSATGATRIAGSLNFKPKYAPAFPTIEITRVDLGKTTTTAALENAGLLAPPDQEPAPQPAASVPPPTPWQRAQALGPWHWPDYQQSLRGAPLKGDGTPDRSLADFMWCKWAIQRGHGIEETAEKLAEVSTKAQERIRVKGDQSYPLLTARNAAAAVERDRERRPFLKPTARP